MTAPFPWFGGKRRWAPEINAAIGEVDVYAEPFAGSLAVLLQREPARREVVCDTDSGICNFWRALRSDPEQVAHWADWPTIHDDLTARHRYLVRWIEQRREQLRDDPDYCDAKAAGWWVWGISLWIGGGWCSVPEPSDTMPEVKSKPAGRGVGKQRRNLPSGIRSDVLAWMEALAARLERVVVLNRPWESAVTDSVLAQCATSGEHTVGILLDPPYVQGERDAELYGSDAARTSDDAATASYAWAVEHGEQYRIAYCCHEGDFPVPEGWTAKTRGFKGVRGGARHATRRDLVMFSPACSAEERYTGLLR